MLPPYSKSRPGLHPACYKFASVWRVALTTRAVIGLERIVRCPVGTVPRIAPADVIVTNAAVLTGLRRRNSAADDRTCGQAADDCTRIVVAMTVITAVAVATIIAPVAAMVPMPATIAAPTGSEE